jgi:hypothetical protein
MPVKEQYEMLKIKLGGHYRYYGVIGNYRALSGIFHRAKRFWRYWLSRRSHKGYINWEKFIDSIMDKFCLPMPRIFPNK